ncbi:RagB/SusD family nutrient uptake outer membrane protein [Pedobacter africanus]|uniref:SusD family protein n=1 Tax=Pedobacter africanus TaxID=151894 RepID=A0A1W2E7D0_9SPHI|nr:RagB/SusD family nutrient uptake outer membrane protein [Pedobacter africanus]SMD05342.1 SusD family protein [Pedobacter africanus]
MKKIILTSLLFSIVLLVSSCKKFLEEQSQTDIIPKTAAALNELLIGAAYNNNGRPAYDVSLRLVDDNIIQNAYIDLGVRGNAYTWQPQTGDAPELAAGASMWSIFYPMLMTCNTVLEYVPKVSGTVAEKENVEGQAHLLRAYYYFMLVNFYARPYADRLSNPDQDLGVPLMLNSGLSFEGKPRNTVAEVYSQVLADLDKGIELMERSGRNDNTYRINHVAGYLLASRVHLHMGNWQKAIDAATNVLSRKSDLMDLGSWGVVNQNTKPVVDRLNVESIWVFGVPDGVAVQDGTENGNYRLSDELLSLFETGDLRSSIYIRNKKSIKRPMVNIAKVGQAFRVSEALLNRAEAYAQLNKLGQTTNAQLAINDLNTLRKKRFSTASYQDLNSSGADELLQKCALEKRKEFFDEESHRWFDLRRSGMPAIRHLYYESSVKTAIYTLNDHDAAYVFQIPRIALDKNPNLVPNPEPAIRTGQ